MSMNVSYLDLTANAGGAAITHLGLVNGSDVEIASASYARQPVTWTGSVNGLIRPTADRVFNMTAGDVVAGWRGFTALTAGTNHGGQNFSATTTFTVNDTFTLVAATTGIDHDAL